MSQLILTLDDDLVQEAQEYARQHGQKLEALVAQFLQATVRPTTTPKTLTIRALSPIVQELYGSVKLPADFDYKAAIEEAIQEKYGL